MPRPRDEGPLSEFTLTREESLFLALAKLWLIRKDIECEDDHDERRVKQNVARAYTEALLAAFGKSKATKDIPEPRSHALIERLSRPGWAPAISVALANNSTQSLMTGTRLIGALAGTVTDRPRAVLLTIELAAFYPWPKGAKYEKRDRRHHLRWLVDQMSASISGDYFDEIDEELRRRMRRLALRRNWRKLAAIAVGGAALGALTGGLAAPLIGGALGTAMGLSGAAATNAGLALLGGGSVAAGGLGMAGGTAVISTAFGVGGAGAGAGIGRALTADDVLAETAKLDVLTEYVVLREQSDEAKAKLVARQTEQKLREMERRQQRLEKLLDQAKQVADERDQLRNENKQLKASIRIYKATIKHQQDVIEAYEPAPAHV